MPKNEKNRKELRINQPETGNSDGYCPYSLTFEKSKKDVFVVKAKINAPRACELLNKSLFYGKKTFQKIRKRKGRKRALISLTFEILNIYKANMNHEVPQLPNKKLEVFLSSDQAEFSKLRCGLAKMLCNESFLTCILIEKRGADPTNVVEASLKAVEKSDIYIGIFGHEYSQTTIKEYQKAVESRLPCFTYVKVARRRDSKLSEFINENLKNQFHYYEFRHSAELQTQVREDLNRFIFDTLQLGLDARKRKKARTKALIEKEEKAESETSKVKDLSEEARIFLRKRNTLEALVTTTIKLETSLRSFLTDRQIPIKSLMSFGDLIRVTSKQNVLSKDEIDSLRRIAYYRNIAVHQGDTPDTETTKWILETAQLILDRLNIKKQNTTQLWELQKQMNIKRGNEDLALIDNFKKSFEALQKANQPKTKEIRLNEFVDWLNALCNRKFEWDDEISNLIFDVVKFIPLMLSDDPCVNYYLSCLNMIINSYGQYTIPVVKKKFLVDFEKMYNNPKFETNPQILSLLMELHEFNEKYIMKIIEDATYQWSDNRFNALESIIEIGFAMMNKKNHNAYRKFFKWLDDKMQDAERDKNEKARSRLNMLRNPARRYTVASNSSHGQPEER